MDDKILDRIQKLLALATSDNVNESAAAAAKAQELMTKYQIDQADLEAATPGAQGESIDNDELFREKSRIHWKTSLAAGIAEANGCKVYTQGVRTLGSDKKVADVTRIVGTKTAVSTVRYMYAYLVREVDRLASANRDGHDRTWLNSFRMGAVAVISTRLIQASKQVKQVASTNALAIIDKDKRRIEDTLAALGLKQGTSAEIKDGGGFAAGAKAGQTVQLSSGPGLSTGARGELKD
jgi:hypothetical protein